MKIPIRCRLGLGLGVAIALSGCGSDDGGGGTSGGTSSAGSTGTGSTSTGTGTMTTLTSATSGGTTSVTVTDGATDSSTGTAGTGSTGGVEPDPWSTDRDDFWGDSRCDALDALFCDGFEAGTIDTDSWTHQGPGTAEIDASQQARGDSSLQVHADGNGFSFLRLTKIFPVPNNTYFGRMFVRIDALPSAPIWAHWTVAEAAGQGDGSLIRVGGQLDQTMNRWGIGSDGGPTGDWTNLDDDPAGNPLAPPEDEWICIEWEHDGASDETRFWWDAVEHPSLATTAADHGGADVPYVMPAFESVWVGWWLYQSNPTPAAYDVWIDEVAFDDERIGCVR